jgi:hypothetical protein
LLQHFFSNASAAGQRNFCNYKPVLSLVAVTSFYFLLSTVFVAVGLDKWLKPLPFSPLLARTFFVCSF